jgi:hypothetical protein
MMVRFSIVLLIKHPSIDPTVITKELKLDPYTCGMAGKPKMTPKGLPMPGIWQLSSWNHIFDYEGDQDFFDEIERLLIQFAPHKNFFHKIAKEGGYSEIYLQLPGNINQGSSVKPSVLKLMADIELKFGVEVFPESDRVRGDLAPEGKGDIAKHH